MNKKSIWVWVAAAHLVVLVAVVLQGCGQTTKPLKVEPPATVMPPSPGAGRTNTPPSATASRLPEPPLRPVAVTTRSHKVVSGETLAVIARKYGVQVSELAELNKISDPRKLRIGQNLLIPGGVEERTTTSGARPTKQSESKVMPDPAPAGNAVAGQVESSHIVKAGECLSEIAVRYGTTTEAIRKANNMKSDRIVAGHKLVVPGKPKEASVRTETPAAAPSPIAVRQPAPQPVAVKPAPGPMPSALASPVNKPGPSRETPKDTPVRKPTADPVVTSAQKPATTYPAPAELQIMTIHDVQANEDIAGVAMTYGVKAEEIRKLNDLGQDPIRPGQRLKIPIPSVAQ